MAKAEKKSKAGIAAVIQPWSCVHHEDRSQVQAYVMATGKYETILETVDTAGHSAKDIAEMIVKAVNGYDQRERLIEEMTSALEICLESKGLNWAAEHDAEIVLRRANSRV